jgi:glycosyltransferase involved in cell wall biosynthesis
VAAASAPEVSVIVCTHDRPAYLRACLESLAAQRADAGSFEVIVVDSASPPAGAAAIASLAARHGARLLVAPRPGLSLARNLGARAARGGWLAYIDDDATADADWVAAIAAAGRGEPAPAAIGGRILPRFEAQLPAWWPPELVGVLTVLTHDRAGTVGLDLPRGVEPYGANFIVRADALAAIGMFPEGLGRIGKRLLSNEESLVLRRLRDAGGRIAYDPAVIVTHSIQAERLSPAWLLRRQFWQGVSEACLRALLGERRAAWLAAPRRLAVALLLTPLLLLPVHNVRFVGQRARAAYSWGFLRGLLASG